MIFHIAICSPDGALRSRLEHQCMEFFARREDACIVEQLQDKNVHLVSNKENLDTSTPTGKLMLTMIAAINEFERENLLERQREGIAIAKAQGKFKGGQVKRIDDKTFNAAYDRYQRRELNKTQLAAELKISRPTLDKMLKDRGLA